VPEVQVEKTIEVAEDILLPETIASWIFSKVKVATSGWVKFVKEWDVYQIQISNLKTGSAPDLWIYLSKQNEINSSQDISSSLKLANLKSKNGDQIYVVPSDIDLNEYKSIAIHCTQYNKLFWSASMR
jgi:hypothetical protein